MTTARPISENTRREIQVRAYQIWEREGRPQGRQHEHWLMAETEILGVTPGKKAARTSPGGPKSSTAESTATTAGKATAAVKALSKSRKPASKAAPADKAKAEKTKKSSKGKTGKSV